MKDCSTSLISGLLGVIIGIIAQYFINYQLIELPKIELEQKKVDLEAQRQALSLIPQIESACSSVRINPWTWRIDCRSANKGHYPAIVSINTTAIHFTADEAGFPLDAESGYHVDFPNSNNQFIAIAGSLSGSQYFHLRFDKAVYPNGINRTDIGARVVFTYKTLDSAVHFMSEKFPEVYGMLKEFSSNGAVVIATPAEKLRNL